MTGIGPRQIQEWLDQEGCNPSPPDILAFNYQRLGERAIEYMEFTDKEHREWVRRMRRQIDLGAYVLAEVQEAKRKGRKTVRIDEILESAQAEMEQAA